MQVIAMVKTTVPVRIEVDDKFRPLLHWQRLPEEKAYQLGADLLNHAETRLPKTGYYQEVMSVESLNGVTLAEW